MQSTTATNPNPNHDKQHRDSAEGAHPVFLLNPHNRAVLEGRRRRPRQLLRGAGRSPVWDWLLGIAFVAAALWLLMEPLTVFTDGARLALFGVPAEAVVGRTRAIPNEETGANEYFASYQFRVEGEGIVIEQEVTQSFYQTYEQLDRVPVIYAPGNPSIARLDVEERQPRGTGGVWAFLPVGALLMGFGGALLVNGGRAFRRRMKRRAVGEILPATLLRAEGLTTRGDYQVAVRYTFRSPESGEWLTATASHSRPDLRRRALPAPGDPVRVYYISDEAYLIL